MILTNVIGMYRHDISPQIQCNFCWCWNDHDRRVGSVRNVFIIVPIRNQFI